MTQPTNPYAAPTAAAEDFQANKQPVLASREARLMATLFNYAVPAVLSFATIFVLLRSEVIINLLSFRADNSLFVGIATFLALYLAFLLVNAYLLHKNGQTLGKRFLSIKIVRTNGEAAGLLRIIFLRYGPGILASVIPPISVIYPLADSLLIFRESRKCLHDDIADTIVIKADNE